MIGEIKIPLPLVPSKSYQLNKRIQQSFNDSGVPGVPSSLVQAVASGIGTPATINGIESTLDSVSASCHTTSSSSMVQAPTRMVDVCNDMNHHSNEGMAHSGASHSHVPSHLNQVFPFLHQLCLKPVGLNARLLQKNTPLNLGCVFCAKNVNKPIMGVCVLI